MAVWKCLATIILKLKKLTKDTEFVNSQTDPLIYEILWKKALFLVWKDFQTVSVIAIGSNILIKKFKLTKG